VKLLIVRLSSFGDILQAQPCLAAVRSFDVNAQIDWLVRADLAKILQHQPLLKIHSLERQRGFAGLLSLIWSLADERYTHIYDAHNNLRSFWIRLLLPLFTFLKFRTWPHVIVRSKNRWKRFLFFKLRQPVFKQPFRGSQSFLDPLKQWGISDNFLQQPHFEVPPQTSVPLPPSYIAIAPSAAWPNKRWPLDYWKQLVTLMPQTHFVVLGGPEDTFCDDIAQIDPSRCLNLAGKISLLESCAVVQKARLTISADTGLLHAADQMRKPNIGLIGPTAFGYTSQNTSIILETNLTCKPCSKDGRDRCSNTVFQRCMVEINPQIVAQRAKTFEDLK
jgi:ADP-heptose:LPS heptosyltransferase